jgi:glutathione S-transferase
MDLYHNNMSTCAQKVRLVLREKGIEVTEHHVNLRAGEQNSPEYLRLNPKGVVPTLVDRGQPIIESSVICEYIEDVAPQVPLRPADPLWRARMRLWTMLPDAGLHKAIGMSCMAVAFRHQILARGPEQVAAYLAGRPDPLAREHLRALLEQGMDAPGVGAALRGYDAFVGRMAQQLEQTPWLAGDAFSLADAMALPYIVRLEHLSFDWWWTDPSRGRSAVTGWLARCKARPSFAAIEAYLDPAYMELLPRVGAQVRARVAAELDKEGT